MTLSTITIHKEETVGRRRTKGKVIHRARKKTDKERTGQTGRTKQTNTE